MTSFPRDIFSSFLRLRHKKLFLAVAVFMVCTSLALSLAPMVQQRSFSVQAAWSHWAGFGIWLISTALLIFTHLRKKKVFDPVILALVALLVGWGILTIWRIDPILGLKQSIWYLAGTVLMALATPHLSSILNFIRRFKYLMLAAGLLLTSITLLIGTNPNDFGPNLWLGCCGFYLQPSEPMKILLILYLAAYFADRRSSQAGILPLLFPTMIIIALACLVLVIQRDLGTASILIFIYAWMIYIATGKKRLLLISLTGILAAAILGYFLFDVVALRYEAWTNPWQDPSNRSFQIVQSLIAIAAGGMTGRGPGLGSPGFVPISFSDFIFSAIAEEFGLPGSIALILIILLLVFRVIQTGLRTASIYHRLLAVGIATYLAGQSILIIGGNIRLLPLTGVTLPFVSYGGSSLLSSLFAILIVFGISHRRPPKTVLPDPQPVLHLSAFLLLGFISLALVNGWWAFWRGPDLLLRTDNARRAISDRINLRGSILDRDGNPLSTTAGEPGDYYRLYHSQAAAHIVGYTQPFFGQAGLEQNLDQVLRGVENQSPATVWFYHLLYGQSPPGFDVQTTLDLSLQEMAASMLTQTPGAVVLIEADTGEILTLFSNPTFDANTLVDNWDTLNLDPAAPFLNRPTQSLYPPGPVLGPFLIAQTLSSGPLPAEIDQLGVVYEDSLLSCARPLTLPATWEQSAQAGCPGPLRYLGISLGDAGLSSLFTKLGFYETPGVPLDTVPATPLDGIPTPGITAYGQADLVVTPLQLALAAASLSNHGVRPQPALILRTEAVEESWISLQPSTPGTSVFTPATADQTAQALAHPNLPIWQSTALTFSSESTQATWYIGGLLPDSDPDTSEYVVAVLIERDARGLAEMIGQRLLIAALQRSP